MSFSVIIYEGMLTLSPASDEWRDVNRNQDKIITSSESLSDFLIEKLDKQIN